MIGMQDKVAHAQRLIRELLARECPDLTLSVRVGRYRAGQQELVLNLGAKGTDATGRTVTSEELEFKRLAPHVGIDPSSYGKTFWSDGKGYVVYGVNPNAPAYPLLARRRHDLKPFKFPANAASKAA